MRIQSSDQEQTITNIFCTKFELELKFNSLFNYLISK